MGQVLFSLIISSSPSLSIKMDGKANWELLWTDVNGVAEGNAAYLDLKNYKVFAMLTSATGGFIFFNRNNPTGITKDVIVGTPSLLNWATDTPTVGAFIVRMDIYQNHIWFHQIRDYIDSSWWATERKIYAIYGVSKY